MSEFINTIEILEDEEILNQLITRSIKEFKDNILTLIGNGTFNYCYDLTILDMPNVRRVGSYAFSNCANLSVINIPKVDYIGSNAFYMAKISYINLPNIETIAANAFNECVNLEKIDINAADSVGQYAFTKTKISTVIIRGEDKVCNLRTANVFADTPLDRGEGYIYVPASMIDSYKATTNWSKFANQFRAIEDYPDICG